MLQSGHLLSPHTPTLVAYPLLLPDVSPFTACAVCERSFGLGGIVGEELGWEAAFLVLGFPGLVLAAAFMWTVDPPRSGTDTAEMKEGGEEAASLSQFQVIFVLLRNPYYLCGVLGQCLNTFGTGGMADWFPTWMQRQGMSESGAGLGVGGITVVGGILGNILGPYLASKFHGTINNSYRHHTSPHYSHTSLALVSVVSAVAHFVSCHCLCPACSSGCAGSDDVDCRHSATATGLIRYAHSCDVGFTVYRTSVVMVLPWTSVVIVF